jgi:hypothetical protein
VALTIAGIPDRYHLGLSEIVALSIEAVEAIAQTLAKVEPVHGTKELVSSVEHAAQISNEKADAIVRSLRSLYVLRASSEAEVPELVTKLITAMQTSGKKPLQVPDQEKGDLETKFTRLLSLKSLGTFSKIEQLKSDHHSLFYDAKILTDLRPVFDQPEQLPPGAIITHTLKIVCHEGLEHKELYFSLDSEDIVTLKKIVERAEVKLSSLKALLKAANLVDFS